MSSECGFSLVSLGYSDSVLEINFWVDASLAGCIRKIRDEWEWIEILLHYVV